MLKIDESIILLLELLLLAGITSYLYLSSHIEREDLISVVTYLPNGSCIVLLSDKPLKIHSMNITSKFVYICKGKTIVVGEGK